MPAAGIAVGGNIGGIIVVAHFLLGKAVVGAVTQIALHVQRVLALTVGKAEFAHSLDEVCQGVAYGSVGEDDVALACVHVAEVAAVSLVLKCPHPAGSLLYGPHKAVLRGVDVAPIDILLAPFSGVAVLLGGHRLGLAGNVTGIGCAVANDEILFTLHQLAEISDAQQPHQVWIARHHGRLKLLRLIYAPAAGIAVLPGVGGTAVRPVCQCQHATALAQRILMHIYIWIAGIVIEIAVVGEAESIAAVVGGQLGQRIANSCVGEAEVSLAGVVVAQVFVELHIEERPFVAHLLSLPHKALALRIQISVIDKVYVVGGTVPAGGGVAALIVGHGFYKCRVAVSAAVTATLVVILHAVIYDKVRLTLLQLAEVSDACVLTQVNRLSFHPNAC